MISLNSIFQSLVPKDKKFFPLFVQASANVVASAEALKIALHSDSVTRINAHKEIERLENQGDEYTHGILKEAASTFVTPFDREDIQALAVTLDDVVDFIHGTSKRIELYKITQIHPSMLVLSNLIYEGAKELDVIIQNMPSLRYSVEMRASLSKIKDLEKRADDVYDDVIGKLFKQDTDALEVLKLKEVLSFMTSASNSLVHTASVIENVLVKFS
ncbi:MAG: DUF47 domain-containing protein [Flavobacteriales bacterium]|jgi:uncharacterized protein Yka (UPF0111/DUF47 family)